MSLAEYYLKRMSVDSNRFRLRIFSFIFTQKQFIIESLKNESLVFSSNDGRVHPLENISLAIYYLLIRALINNRY